MVADLNHELKKVPSPKYELRSVDNWILRGLLPYQVYDRLGVVHPETNKVVYTYSCRRAAVPITNSR